MKITDKERTDILIELGIIIGTLQMCENAGVALAIDSADIIRSIIEGHEGDKK